MKVLQTIASMNAIGGGTSSCTFQLFNALYKYDDEVKLLTMSPKQSEIEVLGDGEPWLIKLPYDYQTPLCYSKKIRRFLNKSDIDVYHTNGLWLDVNHATCAIARKQGKPYVISPHGMLYTDALQRSRWKKILMEKLWFRKDVMQASAIHVTCDEEMRQVRKYGYQGPIAVIGNPIEIPPYIDEINLAYAKDKNYGLSECPTIGFLGRLHPRKQVELIFRGLSLIPESTKVKVVIMGDGDSNYKAFLHQEVARLGLAQQVEFKGFINGREKFEQLSRLSALFVPSDMENFGMIIPEALLVNTPVMASLGTPWEVLNRINCGWWAEASPSSIAQIIDRVVRLSPDELKLMGQRGADFVRENFAASVIASRIFDLYRWLLGEGAKPKFVFDTNC